MNIHAVICTRDRNDVSQTTDKLLQFLCECKISVYLLAGAKSIFKAYSGAFERINPEDDDIVLFCHDDIEIREDPSEFVNKLTSTLALPEAGFAGPAGTTKVTNNAIWWDQEVWQAGGHRGRVCHLDPEGNEYVTHYGEPEDVVVLDGLFLAAKSQVIKDIGLNKPEYFEGEWDFYDIHYTSQAYLKGYTNKVLNLDILHNSRGELVGRGSWHKNREAFIANNELPIEIKD